MLGNLFSVDNPPESRIVIAVETNLGPFGERTELIVVDESTVRAVSLLECDDADVHYYNGMSELPERGL